MKASAEVEQAPDGPETPLPDLAPRLLVIVANGITGDSRVQKTAIAAARAGWDVTLLGAGGPPGRRLETTMGAVQVIRLPLTKHYTHHSRGHRLRRLLSVRVSRPQAGRPHLVKVI